MGPCIFTVTIIHSDNLDLRYILVDGRDWGCAKRLKDDGWSLFSLGDDYAFGTTWGGDLEIAENVLEYLSVVPLH